MSEKTLVGKQFVSDLIKLYYLTSVCQAECPQTQVGRSMRDAAQTILYGVYTLVN